MGSFLENLKKDLEAGDFNSEAARKINEIDKLANTKKDADTLIDKRLKEAGTKIVTEEEAVELNSKYEIKLEEIKKQDTVNKALVFLIEIEDAVKASIEDMMTCVNDLEQEYEKEFEEEKSIFGELYQKIEDIKSKYNPIINNLK